MGSRAGWDTGPHSYDERDQQEETWRLDVLARVEKGEITPDQAVDLLRRGQQGVPKTESSEPEDE